MRITVALTSSLCLALACQMSQAAPVLMADFQGDPARDATGMVTDASITEAGFISLEAPSAANAAVGDTFSATDPISGVGATIGATTGFFNGRRGVGQDRGGDLANLSLIDLHGDVIAARGGDGGFTITLTGLTPGLETSLTAYHNEPNGGNPGFATVGATMTPSILSGATLVGMPTIGEHTNLSRPGSNTFSGPYTDADLVPSMISFLPSASTVELLIQSGSTNGFAPVSGIVVAVPEPGSVALVGSLLAASFGFRRRR